MGKSINLNELTEEQREKIRACKTPEDYLALAKSEGVELTDEQLESIAGGRDWDEPITCPECGHGRVTYDQLLGMYICQDCGHEW